MTPMVDLAFLLLTFFVLTTSLNKSFVLNLDMPEKDDSGSGATVAASQVVTFVLSDSDKIYWYQGLLDPEIKLTNFSRDGLRKVLTEKNAQIKKMVVIVKASNHSKYQNVVDILDELFITKIGRYSMVDITKADEEMIKDYEQRSVVNSNGAH